MGWDAENNGAQRPVVAITFAPTAENAPGEHAAIRESRIAFSLIQSQESLLVRAGSRRLVFGH